MFTIIDFAEAYALKINSIPSSIYDFVCLYVFDSSILYANALLGCLDFRLRLLCHQVEFIANSTGS